MDGTRFAALKARLAGRGGSHDPALLSSSTARHPGYGMGALHQKGLLARAKHKMRGGEEMGESTPDREAGEMY